MRISCIQMDMLPGKPAENFAHAEALVRETAAREKPDVIVLPETWNAGFAPGVIGAEAADADGAQTKRLCSALASELNVNLVAGSVLTTRGGRLYNTAYIFARGGRCIAQYDKTHLFSPMGEDKAFARGESVCRFTLDGARCGVIVCYDLRFPELARTLALPGLELLFIVSQWPEARIAHLSVLSRARAIENQLFVALCNSCGRAENTRYGGHSALIDPLGTVLTEAGADECVISADATLSTLPALRAAIPVFTDRRPELYEIS